MNGNPCASCHARDGLEQRRDGFLVADQVVVDDEDDLHPPLEQLIQLGDHLGRRLQPGAAAEGDDDVAELALKRTAPGELDAAEEILRHVEQVVPRHGHPRHVGSLRLFVAGLDRAALPVAQETRPRLFGLADEDRRAHAVERVLGHADPRPADHGQRVPTRQLRQDLVHPRALDAHAGEADDVGPGDVVEVDRRDVLVDDAHAVRRRGQRREQGQAGDRHRCPLAEEGQRALEAPVRRLEAGIDQHDVGTGAIGHRR